MKVQGPNNRVTEVKNIINWFKSKLGEVNWNIGPQKILIRAKRGESEREREREGIL